MFRNFIEQACSGLRTTGALLVGNAVLVYHGVLGSDDQVLPIGIAGLVLLLINSYPWHKLWSKS
jgi:hypothetical protein